MKTRLNRFQETQATEIVYLCENQLKMLDVQDGECLVQLHLDVEPEGARRLIEEDDTRLCVQHSPKRETLQLTRGERFHPENDE
uniref:Uncharacterized protein n=1 Tax=Pristionchus pacificus TaxID=54126 RepID=A0A2A6C6P9_PRIPA|eukprot:PDM73839.1 hypothetical protein PRIPAC_41195 [Pristionchus pacificus]